jgi:flagellum-specific peptidoglycan hydrolase FlgJ
VIVKKRACICRFWPPPEKRDEDHIRGVRKKLFTDSGGPIWLYLLTANRDDIAIMNARIQIAVITLTVALTAALGFAPSAQAAKLYKWVDAEGNVTYSEKKPPDVKAETIHLRGATLDATGAQDKLDELNEKADAQQKDRQFAQNTATATAERKERMANNCKIAQENMRILRTSSRIQDKDQNGQAYFLDDAGIQAKMAATQTQIDNNCN